MQIEKCDNVIKSYAESCVYYTLERGTTLAERQCNKQAGLHFH